MNNTDPPYDINSFFSGYVNAIKSAIYSTRSHSNYSTKSHTLNPTRRVYKLIEALGFTSKESQNEIVDYVTKKSVYKHYSYKGKQTIIDNPRKEILGLIDDYKTRVDKKVGKKIVKKNKIAATDIADFTFCPASFSLKQTYEQPMTSEMEVGVHLHQQKELETFLYNLLNKRKRRIDHEKSFRIAAASNYIRNSDEPSDKKREQLKILRSSREYSKKELDEIYKGIYGDILKAKCIFYGHDNKKEKPFISKKGNLIGIPDYIFQRDDGTKFIVEEKHTWREEANKPWESHKMQVQSYLHTVVHEDVPMSDGYLMYFSWTYYKGALSTKNARLHKIKKTKSEKEKLMSTYNEIVDFIDSGKRKFDNESISPMKCFKCSSRTYCNNIDGQRDDVRFPYQG